ncbi:MAG: 5'-3' exonuclease [Actinomycetota bacterium]|nr:MAG: 5'-3' exonuclease [Actinomycetota bacterium]
MLLDSASLYFRAYYGVPDSVTAPDGMPVNAVRGLLDFVARLVTDRRPTRLVACWDDDWRPQWRVDLIPSYKAHRVAADEPVVAPAALVASDPVASDPVASDPVAFDAAFAEEVPDPLSAQVPVIAAVLAALGIARVGALGYEADDVIGTLAARARCPVDVVTGDRDLFQLVDDERGVRVLYTARGVGNHEVVTEAVVAAKYGIPSRRYADFAALRGDPSDGLPGVPGIGDKTAAALLTAYGDLAGILAAADRPVPDKAMRPAVRARLLAAADYLAVAPTVVAVATDVDLPELPDLLPRSPADPDALLALAERYGLHGSVTRVLTALSAATC